MQRFSFVAFKFYLEVREEDYLWSAYARELRDGPFVAVAMHETLEAAKLKACRYAQLQSGTRKPAHKFM
jgi:hypothetical protein